MGDIDSEIKSLEKKKQKSKEKGAPAWKAGQKRLEWLMTAIVVVLFIGFAGMFVAVGSMMVDALKDNRGSSNDFSDQIRKQDDKIDALTKSITDLTKTLRKKQNEQETVQKAD